MSKNESNSGHRWHFWGIVITAIITTLGTVLTAYITVIKPDAKETAKQEAQRIIDDRTLVEILANRGVQHNKSTRPLFVWGFCNATRDGKTIDVFLGEGVSNLTLVQTASGKDRISVSFLVPPEWYHNVKFTEVANIGCRFSGWHI